MAQAAYRRAADLTPFGAPILGIAATCALASEPPKRGEHRAYIAAADGSGARVAAVRLAKGVRRRWQEDGVVSKVLLQVFAQAAGAELTGFDSGLKLDPNSSGSGSTKASASAQALAGDSQQQQQQQPPSTPSNQQLPGAPTATAAPSSSGHYDELSQHSTERIEEPLQELLSGRARCVEFSGGRVYIDAPRSNRVYLPGSFNPLHDGHRRLLAAACRAAGRGAEEGCFELSVGNADKVGFLLAGWGWLLAGVFFGWVGCGCVLCVGVNCELATVCAGIDASSQIPNHPSHPHPHLNLPRITQGMLPFQDVLLRVQQFIDAGAPVVVTSATLYVHKAALFPRSVFVVGHDTAVRLVMPKYYGDSYIGVGWGYWGRGWVWG